MLEEIKKRCDKKINTGDNSDKYILIKEMLKDEKIFKKIPIYYTKKILKDLNFDETEFINML